MIPWDANSVSSLKPVFLDFRSNFLYKTDKKLEFLTLFWYEVFQTIFSSVQSCDKMSQFLKILVSTVFQVTRNKFFQRLYCTFSKGSFSLTQSRLFLYSVSFGNFFTLYRYFCPLNYWLILFYNRGQKWSDRLSRILWFHCCYICHKNLSNKPWPSSDNFTPLIVFAGLSTYVRSIDQTTCLILANSMQQNCVHCMKSLICHVFRQRQYQKSCLNAAILTKVIKDQQIPSTVVFYRTNKTKLYTLNKLGIFNIFWPNILKWLKLIF